jgi:uncharacterized repeat protein (TIGR03803 family)
MRRNSFYGTIVIVAFCTAMLLIASTSAAAKDKVLHSFSGPDGYDPEGGLVTDAAGNFYGTTAVGGANNVGEVFELSPQAGDGWKMQVIYSFKNDCVDGTAPFGTLVIDANGNLYGTTVAGGPYSVCTPDSGNGTVFELSPPAGGSGDWTETILHNFTGVTNTSYDGTRPAGGVIFGPSGNLYGTTQDSGQDGFGTVFELIKNRGWEEHVMHAFSPAAGGTHPSSGLVADAAGNLYGTTILGGLPRTARVSCIKLLPALMGTGRKPFCIRFF